MILQYCNNVCYDTSTPFNETPRDMQLLLSDTIQLALRIGLILWCRVAKEKHVIG